MGSDDGCTLEIILGASDGSTEGKILLGSQLEGYRVGTEVGSAVATGISSNLVTEASAIKKKYKAKKYNNNGLFISTRIG